MKVSRPKEKLLSCLLAAAIVVGMYLFDIPCLFRVVFNLACPGCGMTRAYVSLLRFEIRQAFEYNAMFWSAPILLLLYLFDGRLFKCKRLNYGLSVLVCAGLFVNWIVRLMAGQ